LPQYHSKHLKLNFKKAKVGVLALPFILNNCVMTMPRDPGPPNPTSINSLKQTEFVATLENNIANHKNIIYCPTLLFAWDVVKESQKDTVVLTKSVSTDFKLLNQSNSYRNSLNDDEKLSEADFTGDAVKIKSFFNKVLPFPSQLEKLDSGMLFSNTKVSAFGIKEIDESYTSFTRIAFYKDDNNFVIKISPTDSSSEILLVKGLENIKTLNEAVAQTFFLIKQVKMMLLQKTHGNITLTQMMTCLYP
jgi:hypothetical protein